MNPSLLDRDGRSLPITLILTALLLLLSLAGCAPGGLPEPAQRVLDQEIRALGGSDYEVVSAQKAAGPPKEIQVEIDSPFDANPGACPAAVGGEETWCVVIDRPLTDSQGRSISRFLVKRAGIAWEAAGLGEMEDSTFFLMGCSNWDAK